MTTIQMITNDQVLIGVQKPKVAAGDVNSVLLHVDFDAVWDNYTSKSACFHTAKDTTVHEVLMTKNECIVPAAVLADEGIIFIGIRGIKADGETIKTTTLAKYKVVAGATAGQKTIYPELDMYQQYLAAINEQVKPIINSYATALTETIAAQNKNIETFYKNTTALVTGITKYQTITTEAMSAKPTAENPIVLEFSFKPKLLIYCSSASFYCSGEFSRFIFVSDMEEGVYTTIMLNSSSSAYQQSIKTEGNVISVYDNINNTFTNGCRWIAFGDIGGE